MNPFLFIGDETPPGEPVRMQWFPRRRDWKWPEDYRSCMGWDFALMIAGCVFNIARGTGHPYWRTFPEILLAGTGYFALSAVVCGIAL
ncbi:MAG: hypothetical protein WA823_16520 [Candidatus Acidiferrales bacterium]